MKSFRGIVLCVALLGWPGGVGLPQKSGSASPVQQSPALDPIAPLGPALPPGLAEKQVAAREDARQKKLVSDTDKLLQLATELHTDVAKTDKHILSVDVIKRADEIEKLAHAVKERMRGEG